MRLLKLDVDGLRNLANVQLNLSPGFNFFYGDNGSGKTSLLEAVYLLGRGRSFRTSHLPSIIQNGQHNCMVSGLLENTGRQVRMGVERTRSGNFTFRVNGENVQTASSLANELPLLLFNADTFSLLTGGPTRRRAYLDWVVFHVEHDVQTIWRRYQRALKQRNNLLRHDKIDRNMLAVWDVELTALANEIDKKRNRVAQKLFSFIPQILNQFDQCPEIEISYDRGWAEGVNLDEVLRESIATDIKRRATNYGPHRSDLKLSIKQNGVLAREILSRGQQKILVTAMQIASGSLLESVSSRKSVYLFDDLPSELDQKHRLKVNNLLHDIGAQVLMTGVDRSELTNDIPNELNDFSMFHVEHGKVVSETS